jgi:hypothetical protein
VTSDMDRPQIVPQRGANEVAEYRSPLGDLLRLLWLVSVIGALAWMKL